MRRAGSLWHKRADQDPTNESQVSTFLDQWEWRTLPGIDVTWGEKIRNIRVVVVESGPAKVWKYFGFYGMEGSSYWLMGEEGGSLDYSEKFWTFIWPFQVYLRVQKGGAGEAGWKVWTSSDKNIMHPSLTWYVEIYEVSSNYIWIVRSIHPIPNFATLNERDWTHQEEQDGEKHLETAWLKWWQTWLVYILNISLRRDQA